MIVFGLGNEWRGDDAVGLVVARRLREAGLDAVALAGEPLELLDAWGGGQPVVVVDAVHSGAAAGSIHRIDVGAAPLAVPLFRSSTHAFGLGETLELARALGKLPGDLLVYGIEGASYATGDGLSPAVEEAATLVVEEVTACTRRP